MGKSVIDSIKNSLSIIGHRAYGYCLPAVRSQLPSNKARIGILHLSDENLIADN